MKNTKVRPHPLFIIIVSFFIAKNVYAEFRTAYQSPQLWVQSGLGITNSNETGLGFDLSLYYSKRNTLNTIRFPHLANIESFSDFSCLLSPCKDENILSIKEFSYLFGRRFYLHRQTMWASVGVGYVKGENPFDDEEDFQTIGIPVELGVMKPVNTRYGYGLKLVGNLNRKQSFFGVFFNISLGKLR